ncbi:hypothetical protein D3C85_1825240 [compost metagenome]
MSCCIYIGDDVGYPRCCASCAKDSPELVAPPTGKTRTQKRNAQRKRAEQRKREAKRQAKQDEQTHD